MLVVAGLEEVGRDPLAEVRPECGPVSALLEAHSQELCSPYGALGKDVCLVQPLDQQLDERGCLDDGAHASSSGCGKPKLRIRTGRAPAGASPASARRSGASSASRPRWTS